MPNELLPYEPDYAVPPGETLLELLELAGRSPSQLAAYLDWSVEEVNDLLVGKAPITPELAQQLDELTGVRAEAWLSLESNYRKALG